MCSYATQCPCFFIISWISVAILSWDLCGNWKPRPWYDTKIRKFQTSLTSWLYYEQYKHLQGLLLGFHLSFCQVLKGISALPPMAPFYPCMGLALTENHLTWASIHYWDTVTVLVTAGMVHIMISPRSMSASHLYWKCVPLFRISSCCA